MKTIEIKELRAKKEGKVTPKSLAEDLLENSEAEEVVYVVKNKGGFIDVGHTTMEQTKTLGLLEIGKQLVVNDMYED